MERVKQLLPIQIDELVVKYVAELVESKEDTDVRAVLQPILTACGVEDVESFFEAVGVKPDDPNSKPLELTQLPPVVPLEQPVQMNLSPITLNLTEGPRQVRLDWLSNRRVMASQVDRNKLQKAEQKLRLKAQERRSQLAEFSTSAETMAQQQQQETTARLPSNEEVVDGILAESASDRRHSRDLHLPHVDISLVGRRILTGTELHLAHGRRYGLVGRNGIGKSTLLKHLATRQLPVPGHLSVLHVEQEMQGDDTPALQAVLKADWRRVALLAEEVRLLDLGERSAKPQIQERLQAIHRRLNELDADGAEARAAAIMNGLGFSAADQQRRTREFSGGWRMRLALAQALFCEPDLLLLDEPTNMLDFPAVVWLESYLCDWPGTVLVVSHDRLFLDGVATDILHLHDEQLHAYRGDYSQFVSTREERLKNQQREYEAQLMYRQHLQAFVDRWRYNANRASQAQSRLRILEKLPELRPVVVEAPVVFRLPAVEPLSGPLVEADEASVGYEGQPVLLSGITLNIQQDTRLAIVGPNGAGKTTLLKLLTGQLEPRSGMVRCHGRMRVAYFSQHFVDQLDVRSTALALLSKEFPQATEEELRAALGSFGLSGPLALQPIRTLSGGQKSRVVFARLSLQRPHLIVFDEPTNHLDMDTIDALCEALQSYTGGVVVVSHDKRFIEQTCKQIQVCANGRLMRWDGTVHEYARSLIPSIGSRK